MRGREHGVEIALVNNEEPCTVYLGYEGEVQSYGYVCITI